LAEFVKIRWIRWCRWLLARAARDKTESSCREMVRFELVGEVVSLGLLGGIA
jgi:hypothetical protein